jgi:16S rRNA (cytosine967-C5)-methyltransferase
VASVFVYDERLLADLRRVYGRWGLPVLLESLSRPPVRYYFRVNRLRVEPGVLLDEMRDAGYEVYMDELWEEALWLPVRGPFPVRDLGCHIVVDKRTAESVMVGANVYAPGVVRVEDCARPGREVTVVAENGVAVAEAVVAEGAPLSLRAGRGLVAETIRPRYRVPSLRDTPWRRRGLIYEQSISSMTVGRVLSPRPGSVVVDMCAAPGGKTGHVYELAGGRVRVIAVDHSSRKVERLREEMRRLGHHVEVLRLDARRLPEVLGEAAADYVVLDPPCSSLGVIPKVGNRKTWRDVEIVARYQRSFLRAAARLLRPGGILVYSTCTMTVAENEANIRYAVEELGLVPEQVWPRRWSLGLGAYGWAAQRVHPSVHGATGYFVARLRRRR